MESESSIDRGGIHSEIEALIQEEICDEQPMSTESTESVEGIGLLEELEDILYNSPNGTFNQDNRWKRGDFYPFPNGTIMLLVMFQECFCVSQGQLRVLLRMLRNPNFKLDEIPSDLEEIFQYGPKVSESKDKKGERIVTTPSKDFIRISNRKIGNFQVHYMPVMDIIKFCFSLDSISTHINKNSLIPTRKQKGKVEIWTQSWAWIEHPFSIEMIEDSYFDPLEDGSQRFSVNDYLISDDRLFKVKGAYLKDGSLRIRVVAHLLLESTVDHRDWIELPEKGFFNPEDGIEYWGLETLTHDSKIDRVFIGDYERVVGVLNGVEECPICHEWQFDQRLYSRFSQLKCCGKRIQVPKFQPFVETKPITVIPDNVDRRSILVIPINPGGDEFGFFKSVSGKLDSYCFQILCLPLHILKHVCNALPWITFPHKMDFHSRIKLLAQLLAEGEKGGWCYHSHLNKWFYVILCVGVIGSDMVGGAPVASMKASSADRPSRMNQIHKQVMIRPAEIMMAKPYSKQILLNLYQAVPTRSKAAKTRYFQEKGIAEVPSPLLGLKSAYDLPQQVLHCDLHVWLLGTLQRFISVVIRLMDKKGREAFNCLMGNKEFHGTLSKRVKSFEADASDKGFTLKSGGRKANGQDMMDMMPGVLFILEFLMQDVYISETAKANFFKLSPSQISYWENHFELNTESDYCSVLKLIIGACLKAFTLSNSIKSDEEHEEEVVLPACRVFLEMINASPFSSQFERCYKTVAVLEIAYQRIENGSSQYWNQELVETTHKFSKKAPSNMKYPDVWVVTYCWSRFFLRAVIERAHLGVYDFWDIEPLDGLVLPQLRSSSTVQNTIQSVFGDSFPEAISMIKPKKKRFADSWIAQRRIPDSFSNMVIKVRKEVKTSRSIDWSPPVYPFIVALIDSPLRKFEWENTNGHRVVLFKEMKLVQCSDFIKINNVIQLQDNSLYQVVDLFACGTGVTTYGVIGAENLSEYENLEPRSTEFSCVAKRTGRLFRIDPLLVKSYYPISFKNCNSNCILVGNTIEHVCDKSLIRITKYNK